MYTGDVWYNEEGEHGVQTFYCCVGDVVEICHPIFCKGVETTGESVKAKRGFRLIYPDLGDIELGTKWNCVEYHHKKSGQQIIEFVENLGSRRSYLVMETVSVHDHASIPMGGPAFAAYYTETPKEEGGS